MQDFNRQGQAIAGSVAIALLAFAAWHYWSIKQMRAESVDAARKSCLATASRTYLPVLTANMSAQAERMKKLLDGLGKSPSAPDIDAHLAQKDYADRMDEIRIDSAFCSAYARCFPDKPTKLVFEACYETMSSKSDDSEAPASDVDQN